MHARTYTHSKMTWMGDSSSHQEGLISSPTHHKMLAKSNSVPSSECSGGGDRLAPPPEDMEALE